jgi:hypothetical protein
MLASLMASLLAPAMVARFPWRLMSSALLGLIRQSLLMRGVFELAACV